MKFIAIKASIIALTLRGEEVHFSLFKLLFSVLLSLAFFLPWQNAQAERIKDFHLDLDLANNGLLKVTETVRYDFEGAKRLALYRRIPLSYERHDRKERLRILPLSVKDGGKPIPYNCKILGDYANLQIGDNKTMLTGQHVFRIQYDASNAVNFFGDKTELFWSCLGTELPLPVDNLKVILHCPPTINLTAVKTLSYLGQTGVKGRSNGKVVGNTIQFSASHINSGQDFSCVATLPPGSFSSPSLFDNLYVALLYSKSTLVIPAITLVLLFLLWFVYGRDPLRVHVATGWLPPTELTPAELGTLIDEHCDNHDITATLLDLAARGYLIITEVPYRGLIGRDNRDYLFKKASSDDPERLKAHEVLLLSTMFVANDKTYLSTLRGQFRIYLSEMRRLIYQLLLRDQYFARLPGNDRYAFVIAGTVVLALGAIMLTQGILAGELSMNYGLGFTISGLMIILASAAMPKRTAKGVLALQQAKAFSDLVNCGDRGQFERIAREDPTIFGRLLPYACVLGCAGKWAYNFKDLLVEGPDFFRVLTGNYDADHEVAANLAEFDSQSYTEGLARAMMAINLAIDSRVASTSDTVAG